MITNHSSKASDYTVTVAFESPDGKTQLDTGNAVVAHLASGQSTSTDASSLNSSIRGEQFTCKVVDVTRFSAVG
jgi:hypothetical protein